jgi:hypothetical protein
MDFVSTSTTFARKRRRGLRISAFLRNPGGGSGISKPVAIKGLGSGVGVILPVACQALEGGNHNGLGIDQEVTPCGRPGIGEAESVSA